MQRPLTLQLHRQRTHWAIASTVQLSLARQSAYWKRGPRVSEIPRRRGSSHRSTYRKDDHSGHIRTTEPDPPAIILQRQPEHEQPSHHVISTGSQLVVEHARRWSQLDRGSGRKRRLSGRTGRVGRDDPRGSSRCRRSRARGSGEEASAAERRSGRGRHPSSFGEWGCHERSFRRGQQQQQQSQQQLARESEHVDPDEETAGFFLGVDEASTSDTSSKCYSFCTCRISRTVTRTELDADIGQQVVQEYHLARAVSESITGTTSQSQ